LIVRIRSPLTIARETNQIVARVTPEGGMATEQGYDLGAPPRDHWPQTLPIIAGQETRSFALRVELRRSAQGQASVEVGFAETSTRIAQGQRTMDMVVPRDCMDMDGDGYGVGFGCKGPDCDDTRADIPDQNPCPPAPDGGVGSDGGMPGGLGPCILGDSNPCQPGQACVAMQCFQECSDSVPCADLSYGCVPGFDVCLCKAPCFTFQCSASACVNGCCRN
jgi:hypothetical protein